MSISVGLEILSVANLQELIDQSNKYDYSFALSQILQPNSNLLTDTSIELPAAFSRSDLFFYHPGTN